MPPPPPLPQSSLGAPLGRLTSLFPRKAGRVDLLADCAVPWGGVLPGTVSPTVTVLWDPGAQLPQISPQHAVIWHVSWVAATKLGGDMRTGVLGCGSELRGTAERGSAGGNEFSGRCVSVPSHLGILFLPFFFFPSFLSAILLPPHGLRDLSSLTRD